MSTPSSSTLSRNLTIAVNTNKRSSDSIDSPTERETKKPRSESPVKDKRRRRRKKRKVSVTVGSGILPVEKSQVLSRSMSLPVSAAAVSSAPQRKDTLTIVPRSNSADTSEPNTILSSTASAHDAEIAELKGRLAAQTITIAKHESNLGQIQQSITCQICLDLLHKPYALAPCGHVACHSCLVSWFTSLPDPTGALEPPSNHYSKRKTCPHCRVLVRERPIEIWAIKEMVAGLSQSGLLSTALPPPPEAAALTADPWDKIFRPPRERALATLNAHNDIPVEEIGIRDAEDGNVYRCVDCLHEIWQGRCSGCERPYPAHTFMNRLDDLEDDNEDDIDDVTAAEWFGPRTAIFDALMLGEEGSSEEDDYEGSFIDDDADDAGMNGPGLIGLWRRGRAELDPRDSDSDAPSQRGEPEIVVFTSDEEDAEPEVPRPRRGPTTPIEIMDSSDEEASGEVYDYTADDDVPIQRATRTRRQIIDSDLEEEDASDAQELEERPLRRPSHLSWLYDDEHRHVDDVDENSDYGSDAFSDGARSLDLRAEMTFDQGSEDEEYGDDVYSS